MTAASVYGNTCVSRNGTSTFPSPLLIQYAPGLTGCTIRNNIFYGGGNGDLAYSGNATTTGEVICQGNLWYSPNTTQFTWGSSSTHYAGIAAWQAGTGQEMLSGSPVGLNVNPLLIAPATTPAGTTPANMAAAAAGLRLHAGSRLPVRA